MNRKATIECLKKIGNELADMYGYNAMVIGEDRQKGLWGERFTEYLEKEHGECTEEIIWCKEEDIDKPIREVEEYVRFRFRFSSPCLAIRKPGEVFCEIQLSDYVYETKEHSGNFDISEILTWKRGGLELQNLLISKWDEYKES